MGNNHIGEKKRRYERVIRVLSRLVSEGSMSVDEAKSRLDGLRRWEESLHNPVDCVICGKLNPIFGCSPVCDAVGTLNYICKECDRDV